MTFDDWLKSVPPEITTDALWHMKLYRQALFLGELAWFDVCKLALDRKTTRLSDQLYRSAGSISANISEGYSRASKKTRRVSTNMPWVRRARRAIGITRVDMSWEIKLPLIV